MPFFHNPYQKPVSKARIKSPYQKALIK